MSNFRRIMRNLRLTPLISCFGRTTAKQVALLIAILSGSMALSAADADVVDVNVRALGENRYSIDVTVLHADTGWDHYANGWDVLDENGKVLGTRELLHPHVNEQPFTRSLTITLDPNITRITLRATDSVHGHEGKTITVDISDS